MNVLEDSCIFFYFAVEINVLYHCYKNFFLVISYKLI